jgi:hypothetical protein
MIRSTATALFLSIVLMLSGCNKPTGTDAAALEVEALKPLKALDADVEPAEPTAEQPTNKLILTGDKVNDDTMTNVARLLKLKTLRLKNTSVTAAGLAKVGGIVTLETLDLSGSKKVGDDAVAQIAHLAGLQALLLNETAVTDAGMSSVARLNGLRVLELVNTTVGDAGVEKLKPLALLEELRLEGTKLTDAGLEKLKDMPALKTVYVNNTAVTINGVEKMKQARPDLNVVQ